MKPGFYEPRETEMWAAGPGRRKGGRGTSDAGWAAFFVKGDISLVLGEKWCVVMWWRGIVVCGGDVVLCVEEWWCVVEEWCSVVKRACCVVEEWCCGGEVVLCDGEVVLCAGDMVVCGGDMVVKQDLELGCMKEKGSRVVEIRCCTGMK